MRNYVGSAQGSRKIMGYSDYNHMQSLLLNEKQEQIKQHIEL